jgi:CBS domain-containing protein
MKVSEIMTKRPVCCCASSSTLAAALLMQESNTGFLPVIQDPFTPTLVGVVTDRDLCLSVIASGRDPSSSWVDGCMSNHPIWCTGQDEVSRALDLMKTHQVRRVPVVNEKHEVVGILSFGDLVRKSGIDSNAIVAALQSICEPTKGPKQGTSGIVTAA